MINNLTMKQFNNKGFIAKQEAGFIQWIILAIVAIALPATLYLVQRTQIFKPKADVLPPGAVRFLSGYYTNVFGSSPLATLASGCNPSTGTCAGGPGRFIYVFACQGPPVANCNSGLITQDIQGHPIDPANPAGFAIAPTAPGWTIQIDVFNQPCFGDQGWICGSLQPISYMTWYSGDPPGGGGSTLPPCYPNCGPPPSPSCPPYCGPTPPPSCLPFCSPQPTIPQFPLITPGSGQTCSCDRRTGAPVCSAHLCQPGTSSADGLVTCISCSACSTQCSATTLTPTAPPATPTPASTCAVVVTPSTTLTAGQIATFTALLGPPPAGDYLACVYPGGNCSWYINAQGGILTTPIPNQTRYTFIIPITSSTPAGNYTLTFQNRNAAGTQIIAECTANVTVAGAATPTPTPSPSPTPRPSATPTPSPTSAPSLPTFVRVSVSSVSDADCRYNLDNIIAGGPSNVEIIDMNNTTRGTRSGNTFTIDRWDLTGLRAGTVYGSRWVCAQFYSDTGVPIGLPFSAGINYSPILSPTPTPSLTPTPTPSPIAGQITINSITPPSCINNPSTYSAASINWVGSGNLPSTLFVQISSSNNFTGQVFEKSVSSSLAQTNFSGFVSVGTVNPGDPLSITPNIDYYVRIVQRTGGQIQVLTGSMPTTITANRLIVCTASPSPTPPSPPPPPGVLQIFDLGHTGVQSCVSGPTQAGGSIVFSGRPGTVNRPDGTTGPGFYVDISTRPNFDDNYYNAFYSALNPTTITFPEVNLSNFHRIQGGQALQLTPNTIYHFRVFTDGRHSFGIDTAQQREFPRPPSFTVAQCSVSPSPAPSVAVCIQRPTGDANGDGNTDLRDFNIWRNERFGPLTTQTANFDCIGGVLDADFDIWNRNFRP
ncbi:MAG: hypothetical protein G01um10147_712 [Microgenomates group bacterium Gr01-1014_7]|nr:MAG: hypothetical protein G01um10147_712 [Microgenomates group bacterium Gr01-1014_7]